LRALSNETGVSDDIIKKRMGYWVNNKVVKVTHEPEMTYQLLSHYDTDAYNNNNDFYEDDDRIIVSLSGQEEEEWEVYESYVVGMLSNLGQLPLDRIHNMLKTFVTGSEHKYNKTPQQLSMFLQKLCNNDKLECGADGMYKLIKK
jgi:anaphase-promoting complex subunit 2